MKTKDTVPTATFKKQTTLCDICAEKFSFLIVAWGRELNEKEKRLNKILNDEGKAEKCMYFDRYFNKSFKKRMKRCEGFAN